MHIRNIVSVQFVNDNLVRQLDLRDETTNKVIKKKSLYKLCNKIKKMKHNKHTCMTNLQYNTYSQSVSVNGNFLH